MIRQGLLALGFGSLLSACSVQPDFPPFSASGYIADDGAVRMWRLNADNQPRVLMSVFSPYHSGQQTVVTVYEYRRGQLWQIRSEYLGDNGFSEQLRLDHEGNAIFMQREKDGHKSPLTADEITRMTFVAGRQLTLNSALVIGDIRLKQGQWRDSYVTDCQGNKSYIEFDAKTEQFLAKRQRSSASPIYIAWLDSPEGREILLAANDNFCKWEPTEDSL
ncbi:DUF1481 domain-containing protein [Morganella morganii]|nr:DUF1481 domain-containing protein [Morganella morganii]HAE79283.1 DUF1481 domain-containing protein [Morganella sp. (in: enterobacteria)]QXO44458.1 DUF1481 domain-containing protein [Morganella morganii]QXO48013.1 DUF1481 domain-containing protein [Morganella morganii]QXO51871.1 DUF1481 domain-containing protein [Morganella morganii]QXO55733.1 DUF1481 domain-containing protein [Morganella morganii]